MERTPSAWKGHPGHPVLFVFVQKLDKFWYANCLWLAQHRFTVPSTHTHIWFASNLRTVWRTRVYEALCFALPCGKLHRAFNTYEHAVILIRFFIVTYTFVGNSSKMLNFEGMKWVLEKVLIWKVFCGNPLYIWWILKTISTTLLNSCTIGEEVGHSKKIYVHELKTSNDKTGCSCDNAVASNKIGNVVIVSIKYINKEYWLKYTLTKS